MASSKKIWCYRHRPSLFPIVVSFIFCIATVNASKKASNRLFHVPLYKAAALNDDVGLGPVSAETLAQCAVDKKLPEIVISPIAKQNTTLVRIANGTVTSFTDDIIYSVYEHPIVLSDAERKTISQVFAFNNPSNAGELRVAYEKLYSVVDLTQQYDVPLPLVVKAQSGQQACLLNYTLRFFDNYLAVEPDWEVNPVLQSSYDFEIDCPMAGEQLVGQIGDEYRNEIYGINYILEEAQQEPAFEFRKSSSKASLSDDQTKSRYLNLNQTSGEIRTHKKFAPPKNSTFVWKVSASALRQRKIYSYVTITFGSCAVTDREQAFRFEFIARCAKQGDILGALPREVDKVKMASYVIFPGVRDFSVTADGQMRVLARTLDPRRYNNIQISAQTEDGQSYVFHVNITNEPCVQVTKLLPTLGVTEVNCPQLGSVIINLARLSKFRDAMTSNKVPNGTLIVTNMPATVQVTPGEALVWTRKPSASDDSGSALKILIMAKLNSTTTIPLGYVNVKQAQEQTDCSKPRRAAPQNLLVRCATEGLPVAFIDPSSLPIKTMTVKPPANTTSESLSLNDAPPPPPPMLRFSLCCSEYYEMGALSGVVSVSKVPPDELTSMLSVKVTAPADADHPDGFVIVGVIYLFTDADKNTCNTQDFTTSGDLVAIAGLDANTPDYLRPSLKCLTFGDSDDASVEHQLGVVDVGNKNIGGFVGQMSAVYNRKSLYSPTQPIVWSLAKGSASSGYSIDSASGYVYVASDYLSPVVTFNVASYDYNSSTITIRPYMNYDTNRSRGLINRQPPHLTVSGQFNYRIHSVPCTIATTLNGEGKLAILRAGAFIEPIQAYDADVGAAGRIYYSLCKNDADMECTSLTATVPPIDSDSDAIQLQIDPQSGSLFSAARSQITPTTPEASADDAGAPVPTLRVRVKVSNDARIAGLRQPQLFGVPAERGDIDVISMQFVCSK